MADIRQRSLNPVETPAGILLGETQHEIHDDLTDARTARFLLTTIAVIPFLRHELPVPAQNGIRCEQRADFLKPFSSQYFAFDG